MKIACLEEIALEKGWLSTRGRGARARAAMGNSEYARYLPSWCPVMSHGEVSRMSVSVVIPVFNAEPNLLELHRQLMPALAALVERFEVILVEDCSRDRSWDVVRRLALEDERVRGIHLNRNYGQHNALLCGIRAARYDVIVTMDDDLQHPVSEIRMLLARLADGYDVVYGTPERAQHDLWRNLASRLTKLALQSAMGAESAATGQRVPRASGRGCASVRGLSQPVRLDRRAADLGYARASPPCRSSTRRDAPASRITRSAS